NPSATAFAKALSCATPCADPPRKFRLPQRRTMTSQLSGTDIVSRQVRPEVCSHSLRAAVRARSSSLIESDWKTRPFGETASATHGVWGGGAAAGGVGARGKGVSSSGAEAETDNTVRSAAEAATMNLHI